MADPREGYNSGVNRSISGTINSSGGFEEVPAPVGNGVIASDYAADKSVTTASQREAIPTGAVSLEVYNQGATNFMRFRFGDSTVVATVTTGFFVDAGERLSVPVPSGATHWAYIADTAGVTASTVWGG